MAPRHKSNLRKVKVPSPLPTLHPHAAGLDVGARELYVAVPPGSDPRPVRCFATFTEDLHALRDWLIECGVTSVLGRFHSGLAGGRGSSRNTSR